MRTFTAIILQTPNAEFIVRQVDAINLRAAKAAFADAYSAILLDGTFDTAEEAIAAAFDAVGDGAA